MSGGPISVTHMSMSSDGVLYVADATGKGATQSTANGWRYVTATSTSGLSTSTWTNLTPQADNSWMIVAADPINAGHMILGDISGNIDRSDNYGSAFYGCYCNTEIRNAGDVPWIGPQSPYLSAGNMAFDTQVSNKLWFAEGFAIWYTTPPASSAQLTWTPLTQNNNESIVNIVLKPPGGLTVIGFDDFGIFSFPDTTTVPSATNCCGSLGLYSEWTMRNLIRYI